MKRTFCIFLFLTISMAVNASEISGYKPGKVAYDVSSADASDINNILDRISLLQKIYGSDPFESSIVIIIHEGAIPLFSTSKNTKYREIIERAKSLTHAEVIQFRVCQASAKMQGLGKKDFHDFIQLVPMADAELVKLQHAGYAYLH